MGFSHRYPASDASSADSAYTLMQFVEYHRENPDSQPTEKFTGSIRLPLPTALIQPTSLMLDAENLGILGTAPFFGGEQWTRFFKNAYWGDYAKMAALYFPAISDSDLGKQFNRYIGMVKNPHTTAIFQGVNLRNHDLQWRVSPRSQDDADAIDAINKAIQSRIHPELGLSGFALNYPDQVYITFPNTKLPSIRKSFIKNSAVSYGSGPAISLFKDGSSVERSLSLSLIEVDIVTRNEITGSPLSENDPNSVVNGFHDFLTENLGEPGTGGAGSPFNNTIDSLLGR